MLAGAILAKASLHQQPHTVKATVTSTGQYKVSITTYNSTKQTAA
jgi:hypothetical protein